MKHKIKLYLLLILTALLLVLANPSWHWLDMIRARHPISSSLAMAMVWGEACLAVAAFGIVITLLTPPFSRFFLGYESKKPDEGDEVLFFVLLTLFIFGLCFVGQQLLMPPPRNVEKDLKYICDLLNDNDIDVGSDAKQEKVDAICAEDEPEKPASEKE